MGEQIHFVPDVNCGAARDAEFRENFLYGLIELLVAWTGDVADMKNYRSFLDFFESSAKRSHQALGKIADKSYGVGEQYTAAGRKPERANRRIERCEHPRGDQHFGFAECVEERGLPRVRVTDQGYRPERDGITRLAAQRALLAHIFNTVLDLANAVADTAAIRLQFLFARSANTDAACSSACAACAAATALAAEAGHRGALARKARKHVIELCEFDLQLPFAAPRVSRKDIEDELRAIDHAAFGVLFDVALLHGRKIAIENNQRSIFGVGFRANFVEFAPAYKRGGIGGVTKLENGPGDFGAGAAREFDKFS